jgi:hypothetical protein
LGVGLLPELLEPGNELAGLGRGRFRHRPRAGSLRFHDVPFHGAELELLPQLLLPIVNVQAGLQAQAIELGEPSMQGLQAAIEGTHDVLESHALA